jgi:glycine/D-amino acid oxidase-like deaminating enzyme
MENIVVIGGGLMGTSAAWKLAERGAKATLIEQQDETYNHGSSFGTARIARSLGPKKDVFSYAHNVTLKETQKLVDFLNTDNSKEVHSMEDIYTTSPVSYLFHRNQYDTINKFRFKKQKKDYSRASQSTAFRKFGMTIPDNTVVVREKRLYSGSLNPEEMIHKLRLGIEKKGGTIQYNKRVTNLIKKEGHFELSILNTKTKKTSTLKTKQVVVAAGPYKVHILKDFAPYFNRVISPKKIAVSYFKIADDRYKQLTETERKNIVSGMPFFSQIGKEYFAMISKNQENGIPIFKVGGHQKRRNIHDLDKVWTDSPTKKEKNGSKNNSESICEC